MRFTALAVFATALCGCQNSNDGRDNVTAAAASNNASECYDCDGLEDVFFNAEMNAMNAASKACGGGRVELIDKKRDGLRASDYHCRR